MLRTPSGTCGSNPTKLTTLVHSRRSGRDRFSISLRMVRIARFLGRYVCRGRTRALQHHSELDSAIRRRKINDGPRLGGRSMGRGYTHADSVVRKSQSAQRGEISYPFFSTVVVRRRVSLNQGVTFRRRQDGLICIGPPRYGSRTLIRTGGMGIAHLSPKEEYELGLYD